MNVKNLPSEKVYEDADLRIKMLLRLTATRPDVKTNTVHISLNFSPDERLSDEKMKQIADEYMNKIGFGQQPYMVYRHHDSGHDHMHIVTTNITYEGNRISLHNIGVNKSEPARKEIERKYGLIRAEDQKKQPFELKPADYGKVKYGKIPTQRAISAVLAQVIDQYKYTSIPELNAILSLYNVRVDQGEEGSRIRAYNGLQFRVIDDNGIPVGKAVKASSFYDKPTLKSLRKRFLKNDFERQKYKNSLAATINFTLKSKQLKSVAELADHLKKEDVRLIPRLNKEGLMYGVTYVNLKNKTVFNGRELGKEFAAKALLEKIHLPNMGELKTSIIGANIHEYHKMSTEKVPKISWSSYEQLDEKSMLELLTSYEYAASAVPNVWKKKRRKKRR
ncbi:Relaxase/Mobilization nuclease domain protein [compost metagenome]